MEIPSTPDNESDRMRELRSYEILDTLPEAAYDDIVRIASRLLGTPIAAISLIDTDRQWFKARVGLEATQTSREVSFCGHAVADEDILIVPDATVDQRFHDNPLVTGELGIRFYAGAPLVTPEGHVLGTLCVIDQQVRPALDADDQQLLQALARQVVRLLELRRRAREAERHSVELEHLQRAAVDANRAKSDFLASMSHELRTPLNSVIGFTNLMVKNRAGNLGPRDLDFLKRIGANGKHLLRLINDVLDLSKIEAGRVELERRPVELERLVNAVFSQLEAQARSSGVQLYFSGPDSIRPLETDEHRLRQVLINLVGNALKFAADGHVEVRLRAGPQGEPWRIEVADDGIGIAAEEQARIFESFHQAERSTTRRFGGTGLGLTLSRSLCEMMGFTLEVRSKLDRGSVFAITFDPAAPPLVYTSPNSSDDASEVSGVRGLPSPGGSTPLPDTTRDRKTVLIIDDDADARAVLEGYMADYGGRVVAVSSGDKAIEMARAVRPDLITLDLLMPDVDGWAVLRALGADAELREIPVVICSIADGVSRASLAGAAAILPKPVERERFYDTLDDYLEKRALPQTDIRTALDKCLGPRRS